MKLSDAIRAFRDIKQGHGQEYITSHLSAMSRRGIFHDPLLFQERCDFIENGIAPFFAENKIDLMSFEPLGNGATCLVLSCDDDVVLKIKKGKPYDYRSLPMDIVLHPLQAGYSDTLDVAYEIAPKAHHGKISLWKHIAFQSKILRRGLLVVDGHRHNFAYVKNDITQKQELRVIDTGAITPILYQKSAWRR